MNSKTRKPNASLRVAAYLRLSVDADDSVSIEGQEEIARRICRDKGWPEPVLFAEIASGSKANARRPQRNRLEEEIRAGRVDVLIVKSADRLARSAVDFHRIIDAAHRNGCKVIVSDLNIDTTTPAGEMILSTLAGFAQFEARMIGARMKIANSVRLAAGKAIGGPVPYGFRNVKREGGNGTDRIVDGDQAEIVRFLADEIGKGASLRSLAKELNSRGVPSPRAASRARSGKPSASALAWDAAGIKRVMTNKALIGEVVRFDDVVRDEAGLPRRIEARILTDAEFHAVQERLGQRARAAAASDHSAPRDAERALLDGVAMCGTCGGPLKRVRNSAGYAAYRCRRSAKGGCLTPGGASVPKLDAFAESVYLDEFGALPETYVEALKGTIDSTRISRIRSEITETLAALSDRSRRAETTLLMARLQSLYAAEQEESDRGADESRSILIETGRTLGEAYEAAETSERRAILVRSFRLHVRPGKASDPIADRVGVTWLALVAGMEEQAA